MSMLLRRGMLMQGRGGAWTYQLTPEADGRIPKMKIPVEQEAHIHLEWDTSKLTSSGCVFSFYNQTDTISRLNPDPYVQGGYPICWSNGDIGTNIYYVGHCDIDIPNAGMNMFIGYWQDSDTSDRRIYADYLNIRIT